MTPFLQRARRGLVGVLLLAASFGPGCTQGAGRAAVTMTLRVAKPAPRDASVIIDEEYVGPLWMVAARGVRLPVGEHRITVQKEGYFPWDKLVVADRQPIVLDVTLVEVPD
jgi:hypothetical protein